MGFIHDSCSLLILIECTVDRILRVILLCRFTIKKNRPQGIEIRSKTTSKCNTAVLLFLKLRTAHNWNFTKGKSKGNRYHSAGVDTPFDWQVTSETASGEKNTLAMRSWHQRLGQKRNTLRVWTVSGYICHFIKMHFNFTVEKSVSHTQSCLLHFWER